MIKRIQLSHDPLWGAVFKAPLALMLFVAPFFGGLLLSPIFTGPVTMEEWLSSAFIMLVIAILVYINGLFGSFIFGTTLYFFLNAVRMQNKWIYYLSGFAGGTFFNIMHPYYSQFADDLSKYPGVEGDRLAQIGVASFPILFGFMGLIVGWSFWKHISKAEVINGD